MPVRPDFSEQAQRMGEAIKGLQSLLVSACLLVAILASAVGVIYTSYLNRQAFNDWQQLVFEEDELNVEWGQLLLEESTLVAHSRVEQLALRKLSMRVPGPADVIFVEP